MARRMLGSSAEEIMPNQYGSDLTNKNLDQRVDTIKENVRGLVEQGQDKMHDLKTRAVEAKEQAMQRGSAFLDQTRENIKAHPLSAVAIAFGAGYIGMRIFRR